MLFLSERHDILLIEYKSNVPPVSFLLSRSHICSMEHACFKLFLFFTLIICVEILINMNADSALQSMHFTVYTGWFSYYSAACISLQSIALSSDEFTT